MQIPQPHQLDIRQSQRNLQQRGRKGCRSQRCRGHPENRAHRTNQAGLTGAHRDWSHKLYIYLKVMQLGDLVGPLTVGASVPLTLLSTLGTLFFLLGRHIQSFQSCYEGLCPLLLYVIRPCSVDIFGRLFFFENGGEVDGHGGGWRWRRSWRSGRRGNCGQDVIMREE